jgi:dihydroorotase-like cyclic amidohydrolase
MALTLDSPVSPSRAIVLVAGLHTLMDAVVVVNEGVIVDILYTAGIAIGTTYEYKGEIIPIVDVGTDMLMPGCIEIHSDASSEGEGVKSTSAAAAAGGITTIIDHPIRSVPPTLSLPALQRKVKACKGNSWIDIGFMVMNEFIFPF